MKILTNNELRLQPRLPSIAIKQQRSRDFRGVPSHRTSQLALTGKAKRAAVDADVADDRLVLLRAQSQELGPTREAVIDTAMQRLEVSQKHAGEAYAPAETFESNPRSVWGYVQGLTRLSQSTPWQDARFVLDRAASRLLIAVR